MRYCTALTSASTEPTSWPPQCDFFDLLCPAAHFNRSSSAVVILASPNPLGHSHRVKLGHRDRERRP